jgi:hypothetical protein
MVHHPRRGRTACAGPQPEPQEGEPRAQVGAADTAGIRRSPPVADECRALSSFTRLAPVFFQEFQARRCERCGRQQQLFSCDCDLVKRSNPDVV